MPVKNRKSALWGGIAAGLVGGAVLSIYLLLMNLARGNDLWVVAKAAGAPFLGERSLMPGFDAGAILVGLLSHFAISAIWGALFGLLFFGMPKAATPIAGAMWGLVVWLVMSYVVLPVVGLREMAQSVAPLAAALEHVVFGLVVGLAFIPFQREVPVTRTGATPT